MLFNRIKQDKMCKFWRESSFSSYAQHKNRKIIHSLSLCQLYAGSLVEGKGHETPLISCVICISMDYGRKELIFYRASLSSVKKKKKACWQTALQNVYLVFFYIFPLVPYDSKMHMLMVRISMKGIWLDCDRLALWKGWFHGEQELTNSIYL